MDITKSYSPSLSELKSHIALYQTNEAIASHFGVLDREVRRLRREHGLSARGKKIPIPPKKELVAIYQQYGSWKAVAIEYGVVQSTVTRWKRERRIEIRKQDHSVKLKERGTSWRAHKKKTKSGERVCLKCRKPFISPDLVNIRICSVCKQSQPRTEPIEMYSTGAGGRG